MLKLLLSYWHAHREPLPFVLTDDPLYCSHLTKSPFPEVYSVNRVNPLYKEDDEHDDVPSEPAPLKRSLSENETRSSDDTGYSSSGPQIKRYDDDDDDVRSFAARQMSSDSDESSPEAVVVSADVHRVSHPDDVIVLSSSSSNTISANSVSSQYGSDNSSYSQEPFDSLTMSSVTDTSFRPERKSSNGQTEVKRPLSETNAAVRERLQKLLEKGTEKTVGSSLDAGDDRVVHPPKNDLMQSLNRALNHKVPKTESGHIESDTVTRTDSAPDIRAKNATPPKPPPVPNGVTRQDESSASSVISNSKPRKHRNGKHHHHHQERNSKKETTDGSNQGSTDSHGCKLCENAHRPLAFHQLLPGHWSYDNVYLPQMPNVCYHCLHHHHNPVLPSSEDDMFYPLYYHRDIARARHSWAPYTATSRSATEPNGVSTSSKDQTSSGLRSSPDGTSQETDNSQDGSNRLKHSMSERRSLRVPKKCKCEDCLSAALDEKDHHHHCDCYCMPPRRVKFASDPDMTQHRHHPPFLYRGGEEAAPINAAYVMKLPHLNGHVKNKNQGAKENGISKMQTALPRGMKEPIKVDELLRTYPINFRDWEAHYRRTYLRKRRKRAINMIAMAIGILFVVGVAVAMTFVFLRIKRPA